MKKVFVTIDGAVMLRGPIETQGEKATIENHGTPARSKVWTNTGSKVLTQISTLYSYG